MKWAVMSTGRSVAATMTGPDELNYLRKGSMTASEPNLPDDFSDMEETSRGSAWLRLTLEVTAAILILVGIYYLFAPEEEIDLPPLQQQEIDPIIRGQIEAAQEQQAETRPPAAANSAEAQASPTETAAVTPQESTAQPQADGEAARTLIAAQRSGSDSRPLSEINRLAEEYQQQGRFTDAYLLWFFVARKGDGEAAFALASLYDPNHFETGNSLLSEADANQAYKWYSAAAQHSIPQATERLQTLRATLQTQADAGDMTASRLLLNWQ
jgi:TPR repeat protein